MQNTHQSRRPHLAYISKEKAQPHELFLHHSLKLIIPRYSGFTSIISSAELAAATTKSERERFRAATRTWEAKEATLIQKVASLEDELTRMRNIVQQATLNSMNDEVLCYCSLSFSPPWIHLANTGSVFSPLRCRLTLIAVSVTFCLFALSERLIYILRCLYDLSGYL